MACANLARLKQPTCRRHGEKTAYVYHRDFEPVQPASATDGERPPDSPWNQEEGMVRARCIK